MLALPEFDTYHVLRRYAETASVADTVALRWLKHAAESAIYWRSFAVVGAESITDGVKLQLHALGDTTMQTRTDDIHQMEPEQQIEYYKEACKKVGFDIPEELLGKKATVEEDIKL